MSPEELKQARQTLGLSCAGMAAALEMPGRWADRTVRFWEQPDGKVPGPVAVAVRFMVKYGVQG